MLESLLHSASCFVTLTYSDEHLPPSGSVIPKDLQDFLKRLRWRINPSLVRYYAVGEYGELTNRPHYHLALFGYPTCSYMVSRYSKLRKNCCLHCDLIRDEWGKGNVSLGTLEKKSAAYIAGYVTKKLTAPDDPRLCGRHPEFARMSRRPGIGVDFMWEYASDLIKFDLIGQLPDVPAQLRHGAVKMPLGRTLRKKLRLYCGLPENAPEETLAEAQTEMRELREALMDASFHPSLNRFLEPALRNGLLQNSSGDLASIEARSKIYRKRGSI